MNTWEPGEHPTHTAFEVCVSVSQCKDGALYTTHAVSEESGELARTLPSNGEEQIAFALLREALRREVFLGLLITQTKDAAFLQKYREGSEDFRKEVEVELVKRAYEQMLRTVVHQAPDIVKEVLRMLTS